MEVDMNPQRILGVLLLAAGAVLFIIGLNASDSIADRWSNFFTGHFTDSTVWYMVGGIACAVVGALLAAFGGGRRATA
jgi:hypothetical protein